MSKSLRQSQITQHKWYTDREGRTLRDDETNKHHLIFPRHVYAGAVALQGYRGAGGFLQRITVTSHRDLHAEVRPPLLINHNLRNEVVKLQFAHNEMDSLDRLTMTMDYLKVIATKPGMPTPNSRDAWDLLENLQQQLTFINLGKVTLL